uniref:GLTSCR protein conserved domain-containing protein n=1 Tax=Anopheles farauti TaxID=69004 RepID=A0A182QH01_9DIPT
MIFGILSPPGPFLTPSPSPSIPASPRLQPSPSQSPFSQQQDILLVTNSAIGNVTQEQYPVMGTGNQIVQIFQGSQFAITQSQPPAATAVSQQQQHQQHHQLQQQQQSGRHTTTIVSQPSPQQQQQLNQTNAQQHIPLQTLQAQQLHAIQQSPSHQQQFVQQQIIATTSGASNVIPSSGSTAVVTSTGGLVISGNTLQSSPPGAAGGNVTGVKHHNKGPQQILPKPATSTPSVSPTSSTSSSSSSSSSSSTPLSVHQQSPAHQQTTTFVSSYGTTPVVHGTKTIVAQPKTVTSVSLPTVVSQLPAQIQVSQAGTVVSAGGATQVHFTTTAAPQSHTSATANAPQVHGQMVTTATQQAGAQQPGGATTQTGTPTAQNGGSIILPTGNLNAQPLLLNQMPVLVQQNTPQGVQLILRPPTPQIAAPSLVIHNTRPQLQQPQPQQVLRILNANGTMQLATAPTFIVSSQGNLVQQNIPGLKTNQGVPLTQIQGLQGQRQPQQITAAINQHLLSQGVAQIQNLQLNGGLAQIQMPNGLNGQLLTTSLPAQFQQANVGNFGIQNQNINLNQLGSVNLQLATTPGGATFVSPSTTPGAATAATPTGEIVQVIVTGDGVKAQIHGPTIAGQQQHLYTHTNATTVQQSNACPVTVQQTNQLSNQHPTLTLTSATATRIEVEKPKKERRSKKKVKPVQPPVATAAPMIVQQPSAPIVSQVPMLNSNTTQASAGGTNISTEQHVTSPNSPSSYSNTHTSTGKLDLANLMKISGIGIEDDDFMDTDEPPPLLATTSNHTPAGVEYSANIVIQHNDSVNSATGNSATLQHPVKDMISSPPPVSGTQTLSSQMVVQPQQQHQPQANLVASQATSGGGNGSDIMISIPTSAAGSENVEFPYTISIPASGLDGGATQESKVSVTPNNNQPPAQTASVATSAPMSSGTTTSKQQQPEAPSFMITIDPSNDSSSGQASYTVSLPRFGSGTGTSDDAKIVNIATVAPTASVQAISTTTTSSMATSNASSVQQSNTICVNSLMNNVLNNTQVTPTLQSQINEIQNQLMAEAQPHLVVSSAKTLTTHTAGAITSVTSQQHHPIPTPVTAIASMASTVGTSTAASIVISTSNSKISTVPSPASKKKTIPMAGGNIGGGSSAANNKKNGKKLEKSFDTIGTTSAVPTQIGNIQISQVDGTTANQNKAVKGGTINNQIQITPIIDNKVVSAVGPQYQGLAQPSVSQSQATITIQSQMQPSQQPNQTILTTVGGGLQQQQQQQAVQTIPTSMQSNVIGGGGVVFTTQQQQPSAVATPTVQLNQTSITPTTPIQQPAAAHPPPPPPPVTTAQGILSQLTGSLSLSLAENGQLILKHDINQPQTPESQTIMQAILSGALGNITLGQIHFNNVGQVTQSSETRPTPTLSQSQPPALSSTPQQSTAVVQKSTTTTQMIVQQGQQHNQAIKNQHIITNPGGNVIGTKVVNATSNMTNASIGNVTVQKEKPKRNRSKKQDKAQPATASPVKTGGGAGSGGGSGGGGAGTPTVVPRVQTIQLTPQKQQHLKSVQQQIQQLSTKLQNKNLLASLMIPAEFDPTNPIHSKPLPTIKNLQTMTDKEICNVLQRLFMEQQKILSTGKIIPTLPAGHSFTTTNSSTGGSTQQSLPPPPTPIGGNAQTGGQSVSVNAVTDLKPQQAIITPITVTPTGTGFPVGTSTPSSMQITSQPVMGIAAAPGSNMSVLAQGGVVANVASSVAHSSMSITITSSTVPMQSVGGVQKFGTAANAAAAAGKQTTTIIPITSTIQPPPPPPVSIQQGLKPVLNSAATVTSVVNNSIGGVKNNVTVAAGSIVPSKQSTGQTNAASVMPPLHTLVPTQQQINITNTASGATNVAVVNHQQHQLIATANQMPPTPPLASVNRSNTPVPPPLVATSLPTAATVTTAILPPLVPSSGNSSSTGILPSTNTPGATIAPVSLTVSNTASSTPAVVSSTTGTTMATMTTIPTTTTTAQALSSAVVAASAMNNNSSTPAVIIAAPAGTSPSTPMTYITTNVPNSPAVKVPRASLFEIQIQKDQDACTKPDTNTPFGSKQDAIKRLIRYHCMYEEKCEENEEEELQFETTAEWFPEAFRTMLSRYQRLMINESMREVRTSELMLVNKLFKADITQEIEEMQEHLREAENLALPATAESAEDVICVSSSDEDKPKPNETVCPPLRIQSPLLPTTLPEAGSTAVANGPAPANTAAIVTETTVRSNSSVYQSTTSNEASFQGIIQKSTVAVASVQAQTTVAKQESVVCSSRNVTSSAKTSWNDAFKKNASRTVAAAPNSYDDIESEITPSFIMKKSEAIGGGAIEEKRRGDGPVNPPSLQATPLIAASAPPTLRYFNQVHSSNDQKDCIVSRTDSSNHQLQPSSAAITPSVATMPSLVPASKHPTTEHNTDSAYDEWMCFPKDLGYFTGTGDGNVTNDGDGSGRRKTAEEEIHDMFHSNELFSATTDDKHPTVTAARIDSPLSEFFNSHQRVPGTGVSEQAVSATAKGVESRLDALFGGPTTPSSDNAGDGSGINEKSDDLITSRHWSAVSVFQATHEEEATTSDSFLRKTSTTGFELLQQRVPHSTSSTSSSTSSSGSSNTHKRHWTGGAISDARGDNAAPSTGLMYTDEAPDRDQLINPNKRQCLTLDRNDKQLGDGNRSNVKNDDHRWLMECTTRSTTEQQQQQQSPGDAAGGGGAAWMLLLITTPTIITRLMMKWLAVERR